MNREPTQIPYGPPISPNLPVSTGPMVREPQKTIEINRRATGPSSVAAGAFFTLYVEPVSGDTYLQGGTVTAGNGGSKTIADYKVIDHADAPPLADTGNVLYLRAAITATVEDGVMLPGAELTSANTQLMVGASVPDNHAFTVADPDGYIYTEIGRWTDTAFYPSFPGNIVATGCIGNFVLTRDNG